MSAASSVMDLMPKKRRGRKRKVDKLLEEQAVALMAAQQAHKEATMQPESDLGMCRKKFKCGDLQPKMMVKSI